MNKNLKILTYNIHKGLPHPWRLLRLLLDRPSDQSSLEMIKELLKTTDADIIFIQEITGTPHLDFENQLEFVADSFWPHHAYGKNAVYEAMPFSSSRGVQKFGHHGNAIISKYPIASHSNFDLSLNRFEKRGLLHCEIDLTQDFPGAPHLHAFCTHLNLLEGDRVKQYHLISDHLKGLQLNPNLKNPIILAGDFNDWRGTSAQHMSTLNFTEVVEMGSQKPFKTFPCVFPLLSLDRVYYKNMHLISSLCNSAQFWTEGSDHLAISAEFRMEPT